jgi:two-component system, cell cycle response regulator DivK
LQRSPALLMRVIIVDDHGDTRAGYTEFLGVFGFDVRSGGDAEQLRAMMHESLPDAIVLDLQLPRTDGWQLTREIKENSKTRHIAVIVVSACVMPAEREAAQAAGCDVFIAKPCDPMEIVNELRRLNGAPPH